MKNQYIPPAPAPFPTTGYTSAPNHKLAKSQSLNPNQSSSTTNTNQYPPVILCAQQPISNVFRFPTKQQDEIKRLLSGKSPLQTLLKHIHRKFSDQGIQYTLIHKVYECTNEEIQFYVPQLVYIAIKKNCKPIKKLLVYKASSNQSLRRLILWNVKAFTVLMKEKDLEIKRLIEEFEESIIATVKSRSKFNHSQKAIAMVTTASLMLKKMDPQCLKEKLLKFIKRFNTQYLNNLHHAIIIPFRKPDKDQGDSSAQLPQNVNSNYVVHIVQQECSCFPTRKRVPYRIIIETIDPLELMQHQPADQFFKQKKVEPDAQRDLYNQVTEVVEQMMPHSNNKAFKSSLAMMNSVMNSVPQNSDQRYPFVIDEQETLKLTELAKFAKKIEKQEKQRREKQQQQKNMASKIKNSFLRKKNTSTITQQQPVEFNSSHNPNPNPQINVLSVKQRYQPQNNQNLRKFQAIFIPTLPSRMRNSTCNVVHPGGHFQSQDDLFVIQNRIGDKSVSQRYSYRSSNSSEGGRSGHHKKSLQAQGGVKVIQQETRWNATYDESAWGLPWSAKEKKYKASSYFRKFASLKLHNVVVKGGDDLRQEIVCMQLIYKIKEIIKRSGISDIFIKPYEIIVLSENSGILEFVSNSISIDAMKKDRQGCSIGEFFSQVFETQPKLLNAKEKFIRSLVGSSILTYVLKLRDRHNGNILLDNQGNIIHIDFGFILGMSPGGINFQSSPFKLTQEYVEFMGGKGSPDYQFFQDLFCDGMEVLREHIDELCLMLEIMMDDSDLQCFQNFNIEAFKARFLPSYSKAKYRLNCLSLIEKSCMNTRTNQYDFFQWYTNGIHQ